MASNEILHTLKSMKDKEKIREFLERQNRAGIISLFNYLGQVDKATSDRWNEVYHDMFNWRTKNDLP